MNGGDELMNNSRILIVLGGTHHNFERFSSVIGPVLEAAGHRVEATYDLEALTRLDRAGHDLVLLYTCLGVAEGDPSQPERHTNAQVDALTTWVRGGGALLAAHAATTSAQSSPAMRKLLGGVFVEHPPQFSFTVYPVYRAHPITAGIPAFAVHDEFYMERHEHDVEVHMVALDRGVAYPMVWTRAEGEGRVAHIAMGHDEKVWRLEPYQRLMLQTIAWLDGGA
jgi:type 1 glutamine amidotransferase